MRLRLAHIHITTHFLTSNKHFQINTDTLYIGTLYNGPDYFLPWNYGGSYDSDIIVVIGATYPNL